MKQCFPTTAFMTIAHFPSTAPLPRPRKEVNSQLSFCLVITSSILFSHSSSGKNPKQTNRIGEGKKNIFGFLLTRKHFVFTITGITAVSYRYANGSFLGMFYIYINTIFLNIYIGLFMCLHMNHSMILCVCLYTYMLLWPTKQWPNSVV